MRILLVSHRYPPRHRAGVENYTAQLAAALSKRHAVAVATTEKVPSRPTGHLSQRIHEGTRVHEVVQNLDHESFEGTFADSRTLPAFERILDQHRPDLVHFQHFLYWPLAVVPAARARGARTFLTLHDFWVQCGRMGQRIDHRGELCDGPSAERCPPCLAHTPFGQDPRARRWMARLATIRAVTGMPLEGPLRRLEALRRRARDRSPSPPAEYLAFDEARRAHAARETAFRAALAEIDHLLTPSRHLRAEMLRWGLDADRLHHLPQGLDATAFTGIARPAPSGRLRLGFLGTLAPHKGAHVLLDALEGLPADQVELKVHGPAGGDPSYVAELERRAARLPAVELAGPVPRSELARTLASFDLLCVPSLWFECCPLVVQEAFLVGTPCLVSDLGGMAELVEEGRGGLRARAGDAADFRRAIRALLEDPGARERLRRSVPTVPSFDGHVAELERRYGASEPARP